MSAAGRRVCVRVGLGDGWVGSLAAGTSATLLAGVPLVAVAEVLRGADLAGAVAPGAAVPGTGAPVLAVGVAAEVVDVAGLVAAAVAVLAVAPVVFPVVFPAVGPEDDEADDDAVLPDVAGEAALDDGAVAGLVLVCVAGASVTVGDASLCWLCWLCVVDAAVWAAAGVADGWLAEDVASLVELMTVPTGVVTAWMTPETTDVSPETVPGRSSVAA